MYPSPSLQIPSTNPPAGPSRHHHHPPPAPSTGAARPVSVAVHPNTVSPPSSASRRQQRASHTVVSASSQQQQSHHQHTSSYDEAPLYADVYSHTAAKAYAAAHPRRTIPKFGPYLLLQTLGEGEFGKVKLGLHTQWGEEVAVKLIRRGNVDTAVRMSKVEREIEVLRNLKHPNIVRLYDVIETDKYIGIILEYASGGELFDHILAHRYLRERDAAKLFSQLISGVWYIHQKKIVHRDLKLENLLLDRNRNVIITDFGFANRFEHRKDDLMQTSCGSPCYAAPELVISEGLYVGSAVDIWSCGVILYAMLAGYLPFDDDPANPDGDNINLLYKYIVNTPLSFPDYISAEARDLLGMMLVPDPTHRSTLEDVMKHSWLAVYTSPAAGTDTEGPTAFGKSVEQLEEAAMEQHQQKRLAYQRQMKAAALAAKPVSPSPAPATAGRSQSQDVTSATASTSSGNKNRSAQPEYLYDSSIDQSYISQAPVPASAGRKAHGSPSAIAAGEDDPFVVQPMSGKDSQSPNLVVTAASRTEEEALGLSNKVLAEETISPKGHKTNNSGGSGFRHTIQVEYDEPSPKSARKGEDRERKSRDRSGSQEQTPQAATKSAHHVQTSNAQQQYMNGYPSKERGPSQSGVATKPLPPSPGPSPPYRMTTPSATPVSTPPSKSNTGTPSKSSTSSNSRTRPNPLPSPAPDTPTVNISAASPPGTPTTAPAVDDHDSGGHVSSARGHRKGRSSVDKLGFGKIFGGSGAPDATAGPIAAAGSNTLIHVNGRVPSEGGASGASTQSSHGASSVLLSPVEKEKDAKKSGRRNTLTVMVEPFSRSLRGRGTKGRMASTPGGNTEPASAVAGSARGGESKYSARGVPQSAELPSATSVETRGVKSAVSEGPSFGGVAVAEMGEGEGTGMPASTSKARKVMEWFRTKSKVRESGGLGLGGNEEEDHREGAPMQVEYKRANAASSGAVNTNASNYTDVGLLPVPVVVTTPMSATSRVPSSFTAHAPGHPQRSASSATDSQYVTPSLVTRFRNSVTVGGSSGGAHLLSSKGNGQGPAGTLRIHHGAVDQTTITTRAPPEVIKHVKEVLDAMGVEIQVESEYKYRCIRAKRRKGSMAIGGSATAAAGPSAGGLAAFSIAGSAASSGVDKRGLPIPTPSSFSTTGGMLRGLLMRRQSSQVSSNGIGSSQPSLAIDDDVAIVSEPTTMQETVYGDPSEDAGDEVRFSVELTRLDRLNDTFSLDIRRLKGNLRSYKFLYDTIRRRADLQR